MSKLRHILFLLLSFCMAGINYAQKAAEPVHRQFKPETIEKYKQDSDYDYIENFKFSISDWLLQLIERILRFFDNSINIEPPQAGSANFFEFVLWIVAALAVAGIIYIIFKGNWNVIFSGRKFKKKKEEYSVYDEDIHNINFSDEIELAVQQKNYRKATRLFYLKSLKSMSDAGIIDWRLNKTNTDYRWEIKDKKIRNEFDFLSTTFEYVWYGEFEPGEDTFLQTFDRFRSFNNQFQPIEKP